VLLAGLSPESVFRRIVANEPLDLSSEQAQAFISTL